ncbi:allantoate amidohydrolase [Ornithinimicrobium pratense]|uniref:Allantoate amidohydrolase n=2 Tax=Ornithinimicrobium pratense TaxID=2593973 RepID=A0A5J6V8L9_9MICO|nr:allantoate amidohydrolase [Ornithinimicrobium pratense]
MWSDLESVGRVSSGGYRRFAWTAEDHTLREWFAGECARRGLDVTEDRVGNQWGWWWDGPGTVDEAVATGRKAVVTGSHLDSVPDGGAFDGPLGVVCALTAVDQLRAAGITPQVPVAVTNFVDEEGARFGIACAGSRVLTGQLDPATALALTDADGTSYADALRSAGRGPETFGPDPEMLRRVGAFVELHVEQGRALVDLDAPVAVASDIWPHGRWRFDFPGEANHAGTTRLEDRRDAMLGYADLVLGARQVATQRGCVATVGKVRVTPGGVNAIPSHVTGWLDARGADEEQVVAMVDELTAGARETGAAVTRESWTPTTRFDQRLSDRLRRVLDRDAEVSAPVLGTGAGHDAGILATAGIPSAMLFVRNPTGVSHSPAEHAEREDCLAGVAALTECLRDLTTGEVAAPTTAETQR